MLYGLPYMGSKNKIAEKIVSFLPRADNFYDLFCGGGAITHCAILKRKYKNFFVNDIDKNVVEYFKNGVEDKYKDRTEWITREDWIRLKDTDPFVKYIWSFGNRGGEYMYGRDTEQYKHALHNAIFLKDYEKAKEFGYDLSPLDKIDDIEGRYLKMREIVKKAILERNLAKKSNDKGKPHLYLKEDGTRADNYFNLQNYTNFKKSLIELWSYSGYIRIQNLDKPLSDLINYSYGDYQNVPIKPNSVIYCDIPYKDTKEYKSKDEFDYDRFYDWCSKQTEKVFVSSYEMPEDLFVSVLEIKHYNSLCATMTKQCVEKLFVPKHQYSEKTEFSFGDF